VTARQIGYQIERRDAAQLKERAGVVPPRDTTTPIWQGYDTTVNRRMFTSINLPSVAGRPWGGGIYLGGGGALVGAGAGALVEAGVVW
jgi:hypothetical protein